MTVSELSQWSDRELASNSNVDDNFNGLSKYQDIWNDTHTDIVAEHSLPGFHLWGDGFCQGDASDEEIEEVAKQFKIDTTDVFDYLDGLFVEMIYPKVEKLIAEYKQYQKNNEEE